MAWYSGAYAAWKPKGAADSTAAKNDLTGNSRHLTGAVPTWSAENGFYSHDVFDVSANVPAGTDFSLVWHGVTTLPGIRWVFWNSIKSLSPIWAGIVAQYYFDGHIYAGCNATQDTRFNVAYQATEIIVIYIKKSDYSQRLIINNSEVSGSPKAGTAQTNSEIYLCTGYKLFAAGIWDSELSDSQMTAIYNELVLGIAGRKPLITLASPLGAGRVIHTLGR